MAQKKTRMTKQLREFLVETLPQMYDQCELVDLLIDRMSEKDKRYWADARHEHSEMMGEAR